MTTMRKELTFSELDSEHVELLPARDTLTFFGKNNWATVLASNSSTALNVASFHSIAASNALQSVSVSQS
ncbi:hypothetical protein [Nocardioides sp. AN3]